MGKEILAIKEEKLHFVVDIIRAGLEVEKVPSDVSEGLLNWCSEKEEYLRESFTEEFWPKKVTK